MNSFDIYDYEVSFEWTKKYFEGLYYHSFSTNGQFIKG